METKEEKFRKLVQEYGQKITQLCGRYAPVQEDSKDLYQEILVNIWKSLDSFRGEAQIGTWIYRIAVNTSLTISGKRYKLMKCRVDMENPEARRILTDEDEVFHEEDWTELQNHLNELNVIDKAIIGLVLDELSAREISEIIGITEPNVRVKIHRIKEHLRNKMKRYENAE